MHARIILSVLFCFFFTLGFPVLYLQWVPQESFRILVLIAHKFHEKQMF